MRDCYDPGELNSVETAIEDGWKAGYNDFQNFVEGQTKNPYTRPSKEYDRWIIGYAQGYNIAHRQGKPKIKEK